MIEGDWRGEEDSGKYLVIKEKMLWLTRFFYKKNWQKIKQMLSNTLRLNFYFLKIIHVLHSRYHPGVVWHIPGAGVSVFFSWGYAIGGDGGGRGVGWILAGFSFWRLDWALGYHYWAFWDFLIFANSLRSRVLSCSATRSYHVYKK